MIYGKFVCTFCYCKKKEYNSEPKAISMMPCSLNSRERQTLNKKFTVVEGNEHFQEGNTSEFSSLSWVGCGLCRRIRESLMKKYYLSRDQNKECIEPCTYFGKKCFIRKNRNCTGLT